MAIWSFVIFVFALLGTSLAATHLVHSDSGNILGSVETVTVKVNNTATTKNLIKYFGIPYAEAPVGNNRFRRPLQKKPWTGQHNGTLPRPSCPGYDGSPYIGGTVSEDCLVLDVYAPEGSSSGAGPYPVLVYLHGEADASKQFTGDNLCAFYDVIVVVVKFRYGFLGFFTSGDGASKGNYGLWDQHLAIKWIHTNINAFNGDKARITLSGHGIGATYAVLQAAYPGNKGKIARVIAQSSVAPALLHRETKSSEVVKKAFGCLDDNSVTAIGCLRQKTLVQINSTMASLAKAVTFPPVSDGEFVLSESMSFGLATSRNYSDMFAGLDLLLGINSMDGGYFISKLWTPVLKLPADTFTVNTSYYETSVIPKALQLAYGKRASTVVSKATLLQYSDLTAPNDTEQFGNDMIRLFTDLFSAVPTSGLARRHAAMRVRGTYLFEISSQSGGSLQDWLAGRSGADDLYAMDDVSSSNNGGVIQTIGNGTSGAVLMMWSNFIKTGDPSRASNKTNASMSWPPYNSATSPYLTVSQGSVSVKQYFREPAVTFWMTVVTPLMGMSPPASNKTFSNIFDMNPLTTDNVLLVLVILGACLVLAAVFICFVAISLLSKVRSNNKPTTEPETKSAKGMWITEL